MDVVVFRWSALDDRTRTRIIEHEQWKFGDTFPIDKWFAKWYDTTSTTIIATNTPIVIDFEMTMEKEKYVEFCLKWM